jgi:hypothetical protein
MSATTKTKPIAAESELTAAEIDAAVAGFQQAITAWETSPLTARSPGPLMIDSELVASAIEMLEVFETAGTRGAEIGRQELLLLAETFRERLAEWISKSHALIHGQPPATDGIWMYWREMLRHKEPRKPRPAPDSPGVQVLNLTGFQFNPNVAPKWEVLKQIALELQWRDQYGRWDTNKVLEELNAPGTHWKPDEFVDHKFQKYAADLAQRWAAHRGKLCGRRGLPVLPPFAGGSTGATMQPASFLR